MRTYDLPNGGGSVVLTGSDEDNARTIRKLEARHAFTVAYCTARGWPTDAAKLTIDQILEIREQAGWESAGDASDR